MTDQDPFERDLRASLDEMASEPAPDRLVDRVAGIPQEEPAADVRRVGTGSGLSRLLRAPRATLRVTGGLAAAAVLVAAAALVVATLPGGGPFAGGRPGPTATFPVAVTASPGAVATPTPAPSTAASPQVAGPTGGAVTAGFRAASVTFVSADLGWVLGATPCNTGTCASIARTTDGARTWAAIPAPSTVLAPGGISSPGTSGVSELRFADPLDGWAFGPELWATHDGGATWHQVTIPGIGSGGSVVALESLDGVVHAVAWNGSGVFRIASSPVTTDSWTVASTSIPVGAGPVPQIQLLLSGASGWVVEVDRTVVGGARLEGGTWKAWNPPCVDVLGPAILATAGPSDLLAACDGGVWGPPKNGAQNGEHLYRSTDGGSTFTMQAGSLPLSAPSAMAAPDPSVIALGGWLGQTQSPALATSFDGGLTWTTTNLPSSAQGAAPGVTYLGFTTSTQGVAIVQAGGQGGSLLMTRDGGHTWSPVTVGGS